MIPKSLVISVATGIIAAAALGVYLQELNSQGVVFVQGTSISVYSEKQDYKLGEVIPIQIINSGTSEIVFATDAPALRIRALDGTVFFSTSFEGLKLEPKQKHVFVWDQQKNDDSKVIEGRYIIESFAYDQDNKKVSDSFTLDIFK
ncbi:MAG TPA: hypothetical protein VNL34_02935 [Candidatus Nitrosotenuis sp.]|nr:hypothetical protein [Candidatus Nitrosotenuis sp.]